LSSDLLDRAAPPQLVPAMSPHDHRAHVGLEGQVRGAQFTEQPGTQELKLGEGQGTVLAHGEQVVVKQEPEQHVYEEERGGGHAKQILPDPGHHEPCNKHIYVIVWTWS